MRLVCRGLLRVCPILPLQLIQRSFQASQEKGGRGEIGFAEWRNRVLRFEGQLKKSKPKHPSEVHQECHLGVV